MSNAGNGAIIVTFPGKPIDVEERTSLKAPDTIAIRWTQNTFNGGAIVQDYQVSIKPDGGEYSVLGTGLTSTSITASGLTEGVIYHFIVQSRNQHGYSDSSDTLSILSAYIPEPPVTVSTTNNNDHIIIDWSFPDFNGSPITAYHVYVRESDSITFTKENVDCDGTSESVITNRQCTIMLSTLTAAPYSLIKDDSVTIKVTAENLYGESTQSSEGSGAIIWLVPDAPITLSNNPAVTDGLQIGVVWSDGASDGSTPVLDYKLWYALEADDFVVIQDGILLREYTTSVTLQSGDNYKFKVQARNAVGYSLDSAELVVRAARVPDVPTDVTTTIALNNVEISWTQPYNGGSGLLAYQVLIQHTDGVSYTEDITDCDGS